MKFGTLNGRIAGLAFGIVGIATTGFAKTAAADAKIYNMYLYFDEAQNYVDELTLELNGPGPVTGRLHVPNDFDADIEGAVLNKDGALEFHVSLPPKYDQMFPGGLRYKLQFPQVHCLRSFCPSFFDENRFVGFVYSDAGTLTKPVGSVVGFTKVPSL